MNFLINLKVWHLHLCITIILCTFTFIDQSESDLRCCVANTVAVILGSPPQSNHLWYHLFDPEKLQDTYITGFMVSLYTRVSSPSYFAMLFFSVTPELALSTPFTMME